MCVEADIPPASTAMPSLKRRHTDNEQPSTPIESRQSSPSPMSSTLSSPVDVATPKDTPMASTGPKSLSQSPSKIAIQSSTITAIQPSNTTGSTLQSSSAPPAKRRKLTPSEKAEVDAEKAKKAQERMEAKARKDAETKAKEEERQRKAEEKELERKQKEEEKKAREEEKQKKQLEKDEEKRKKAEEREQRQKLKDFEKQQKEEEKDRRERSQMRLSTFFNVPKVSSPAPLHQSKNLKASGSPLKHGFITKDEGRRRSMSLDPVDFEPPTPTKIKPVPDIEKQAKQIDKGFLPFVLGKNMRLAPINAFLPADEDLVRVNDAMDKYLEQALPDPRPSIHDNFAKLRVSRGFQPPRVAHVLQQLQSSSNAPVELTQDATDKPMDVLKSVPLKFFSYGEDVRPPYRGTWTRNVDSRLARKLALKPLTQQLPQVDYAYDSEAEWDDADEGEDIDIEDDEEEDEEEEEMEGFIDDESAPQYLARRGLLAIDVEPMCSGVQWEDASGRMKAADPKYDDANFSEFTVCFLLDPSPKTIDPFTTAYWDPEPKHILSSLPLTSAMGPPRLPLQDRTNGQATVQSTLVNGKVPKAAKVGPRLVPADLLPAFKEAVNGSDMTKIALVEALKKQFPKLRKDQITETLTLVAQRVGSKQAEKKWVLLPEGKV